MDPANKPRRGKKSRSCEQCRRRRVKCDRTRPHCLRCMKANLDCSGSPIENKELFHHEDLTTVAKWHPRASQAQSRLGPPSVPSSSSSSRSITPPAPMQVLDTIESRATEVFLAHGVDRFIRSKADPGFVAQLVPFWAACGISNSALSTACTALSLKSLASDTTSGPLHQTALVHYNRAISRVGKEMADPSKAYTHELIVSVITLSLIEMMSDSEQAVNSHTKHLEGAFALLQTRKARKTWDDVSVQLAKGIRPQLISSSSQQARPISEMLARDDVLEYHKVSLGPFASLGTFFKVVGKVKPLCAAIAQVLEQDRRFVAQSTMVSLVTEVIDIDMKVKQWLDNYVGGVYRTEAYMPPTFDYDPETAEYWPGPIHRYESIMTGGNINKFRACRLVLHCAVLLCATWLAEGHGSDPGHLNYATAQTVCSLVDEICASVPFILGVDIKSMSSGSLPPNGKRANRYGGGAMMLIWPLHICTNIAIIPDMQLRWVRARLHYISSHFGFGHATVLATTKMPLMMTEIGSRTNFNAMQDFSLLGEIP